MGQQLPDFAAAWNDEEPAHSQFEPRLAAALSRIEREICGQAAVQRIQTIAAGGAAGPAYVAEGAVSALHAVALSATPGRLRLLNAADRCVYGVSTSSAQAGVAVSVQSTGELADASWNWTPGQVVFAYTGGTLSQTPPVSGLLRAIGVALSPTRLLIQIAPSIALG